jgi:hypothetical protein
MTGAKLLSLTAKGILEPHFLQGTWLTCNHHIKRRFRIYKPVSAYYRMVGGLDR